MNPDKLKKMLYTPLQSLSILVKWTVLSLLIGGVVGLISSGFSYLVTVSTEFRLEHPLMVLGLPFGGLLIVFLYRYLHQENDTGTNRVLLAIRTEEEIPLRITPLILISTVITHLFGGSSGREGAALQFGGSMGNTMGNLLHLGESDKKIMILASMSAAFSALFGSPMAASIFPMEFISVGIMYYSALVPCVFSSFVAHCIAVQLKVHTTSAPFPVTDVPDFYTLPATRILILGIACAAVGILFCFLLHKCGQWYKKLLPNPYLRIAAGGVFVVALSFILGTQEYLGLGEASIQASFQGIAKPEAFLMKIVFTCLTLCAGYKGGEIVPSLFIGSTLGCTLALLLHLPAGLCAACGMVGVFCAVTNSPISSLLIAFELFGFSGMPYFISTIAVSYLLSGYYSLYNEQKIVYSKTETKYVNKRTE